MFSARGQHSSEDLECVTHDGARTIDLTAIEEVRDGL